MVAQGVLTTLIALAYAFLPDVSSAYWIFSVVTTQIYLVVYLLMFAAAVCGCGKLRPAQEGGFRVPALNVVAGVGFVSSLAALCIGFVPPEQFGGQPLWRYLLIVGGGLLTLGFLAPLAFLKFRKPHWVAPDGTAPDRRSG
ncbi:hypothetical protein GCM10020221_29700 [Streptomyces thioluteus]|uniref:Amino acid permease n=1 Tax=Streptomyces thioluteus TaxID=66431 RepID=A0ABP6JHZ2_STRTU